MAYIWGTGFEAGSNQIISRTNGRVDLGGSGFTVTTGGMSGTYKGAIDIGRYIGHALITPVSEIWIGFWTYYFNNNSDLRIQVSLSDGKMIYEKVNNGLFSAYVDGVLIGSGSITYSGSVWTNFQLHVKISNTGNIDTRVDGLDDIAYSGDTQPGAVSDIVSVDWYMANGLSYLDDLVIRTDDWTGDVRFGALVPTADTADKDWLRSTGADNYALLDERPPNDSDYVYTLTNGDKDLYEITDYDDAYQTPLFVIQWLRAKKNTANTQKVKMVTKSGATETSSSDLVLSTTYKYFERVMPLDPDGAAWSNSVLDALKIGQESVI